MMIVMTILMIGLTAAALIGTKTFVEKSATAALGTEQERVEAEIGKIEGKLADLSRYIESYGSRTQLADAESKIERAQTELEEEREKLKGIESSLDTAQQSVETKESAQQELKSSREEDEVALEKLMSTYEDISGQSVSLEQNLAISMKNLDSIIETLETSPDHTTILTEFSEALTAAGSTLRELMTEHESIHDRLSQLQQQHEDLEDEYTRLVEQQLGD